MFSFLQGIFDKEISSKINHAKNLVHQDTDLSKNELRELIELHKVIIKHIEKVKNHGGVLEPELQSLPDYMLQRIYDEQELHENAIPIPTSLHNLK